MNRAMGMLGLCARAGKLISGEKACLQSIRNESAFLVLIDAQASVNAVKSITDACEFHHVELIPVSDTELGCAIGKPGRMVAAVTDRGFAERISQLSK